MTTSHQGLLFIGDPHLASRVPGFRRDDYPRVSLQKLTWCFQYAAQHDLKPVLLGDLFHWPRENANWLISALLQVLPPHTLAIAGNHDCHENTLGEHDSLTILHRAGKLHLVDQDGPWRGQITGYDLLLGGTSWGYPLPQEVSRPTQNTTTIWITHHDIAFSGPVLGARHPIVPIPGLDCLINGHIHNREPDRHTGTTTWINPGNINRLSRDDLIRHHKPAAFQIKLTGPQQWDATFITVPHQPFDEVFHPQAPQEHHQLTWVAPSAFVQGLEELVAHRTQSGAGLTTFLDHHLPRLDPPIAQAITQLAKEHLPDDHPWHRSNSAPGHGDA